jgi:hypothetical protein
MDMPDGNGDHGERQDFGEKFYLQLTIDNFQIQIHAISFVAATLALRE